MGKGLIFNIQRYSIHDGPGIRTTIFFKGCPLKCWWCHNPESQNPGFEFQYWKNRCVGCATCYNVCPHNAISMGQTGAIRNKELCLKCSKCQQSCFSDAIELIGNEMALNEVMDEIKKDTLFYDESGGGITLSGGEPLLQPDFALDILQECKAQGIHTAVDTCGYVPWEALAVLEKYVDLFLFDIKHMDDEKHKIYTGASNNLILNNLEKLSRIHSQIIVRMPIIPGINDDQYNLSQTGQFIASLGIKQVQILPYHDIGISKYKRMGIPYLLDNVEIPNEINIQSIQSLMTTFGLDVENGG